MAEPADVTLRHASVVLVSPTPVDPQSIRPEALTSASIVPENWILTNGISTPVIAQVQYQEGISIVAEGNRLVFQENIGGTIRPTYQVHALARRYVEATRLVPYNALGMNWLLDFASGNPGQWIQGNLLGGGENFVDYFPTSVQMVKQLNFAACNLNFKSESNRVSLECNYHFPVTQGSAGVLSGLGSSSLCLDHLRQELLPIL